MLADWIVPKPEHLQMLQVLQILDVLQVFNLVLPKIEFSEFSAVLEVSQSFDFV